MTYRVLVFGQTGQVAAALRRRSGTTMMIRTLRRQDADLIAPERAARQISAWKPDAVINAAAFTAVDMAEVEGPLAHRLNAVAPGILASVAARHGIPFLHLSTDYVFDGSGTQPWTETDLPRPVNAYGSTKLIGEQGVLATGGQATVIRTSWVFSGTGRNFLKTMLRAGAVRPRLTVVDDQIGGPTSAEDIADALLIVARALIQGRGAPGLYHYAGQPWVTWAEFARAIFAARGGVAPVVEPISSRDWPTPAQRPLNSRLDCSKIRRVFGIGQPDWRAALGPILTGLTEAAA